MPERQCPACGYIFEPLEDVCPRCAHLPGQAVPPPAPTPASQPQPAARQVAQRTPWEFTRILPYTVFASILVVFVVELFIIRPYLLEHYAWARTLHMTATNLMYSAPRKNALNRISTFFDIIVGMLLGYVIALLMARRTPGDTFDPLA